MPLMADCGFVVGAAGIFVGWVIFLWFVSQMLRLVLCVCFLGDFLFFDLAFRIAGLHRVRQEASWITGIRYLRRRQARGCLVLR
jgi:hypothetical protein